ncbi:uncharacterized protein ACO6RY_14639 [Pungitius sinensis]
MGDAAVGCDSQGGHISHFSTQTSVRLVLFFEKQVFVVQEEVLESTEHFVNVTKQQRVKIYATRNICKRSNKPKSQNASLCLQRPAMQTSRKCPRPRLQNKRCFFKNIVAHSSLFLGHKNNTLTETFRQHTFCK